MKIKNTKNKKINSSTGFTIIETLVAIFVLLISTTGPLTFAQSGLRASFQARDQVTAFYLAQDVIEVIKNIRDNTNLENRNGSNFGWLEKLDKCNPSDGSAVCNIDTGGDINIISCNPNGCSDPLKYDKDTGSYLLPIVSNSSKPNSKYTRTIYINEIVTDREAQIIVKVSWTSNIFGKKDIVVQENIFKNYE